MVSPEIYTPGYSEVAVRYMSRRHAARDAAFLLPHLKPGMSLLDCGCGPGTITVGLAQAVAPGSVTAVDVEPSQVAAAQQLMAERHITNVQAKVASVYELPFPDGSFDAAFSHALFEHLGDPPHALKELKRVLKPGGLVALCSPDWGGVVIAPPSDQMDAAIACFTALQRKNGGNPNVGRILGRLLIEAGFSSVLLSAHYDCYEDTDMIARLFGERIETAVAAGVGDTATVQRHCRALLEWSKQPGTLFAQCLVSAVGTK